MMRIDRSQAILVSVFAFSLLPFAMAGAPADQAAAKAAEQEVVQEVKQEVKQELNEELNQELKQLEEQSELQAVAPAQEVAGAAGEPPDGEVDLPADPQAVVKTKTKSNQSND